MMIYCGGMWDVGGKEGLRCQGRITYGRLVFLSLFFYDEKNTKYANSFFVIFDFFGHWTLEA